MSKEIIWPLTVSPSRNNINSNFAELYIDSTYMMVLEEQKGNWLWSTIAWSSMTAPRQINNTLYNSISGSSLNIGTFILTLPAWKYEAEFSVPCGGGATHKGRLRNLTDSTTVITWTSENSPNAQVTRSRGKGVFTIASAKTFQLQHWILNAGTNNWWTWSASWEWEVYSTLVIKKLLV